MRVVFANNGSALIISPRREGSDSADRAGHELKPRGLNSCGLGRCHSAFGGIVYLVTAAGRYRASSVAILSYEDGRIPRTEPLGQQSPLSALMSDRDRSGPRISLRGVSGMRLVRRRITSFRPLPSTISPIYPSGNAFVSRLLRRDSTPFPVLVPGICVESDDTGSFLELYATASLRDRCGSRSRLP